MNRAQTLKSSSRISEIFEKGTALTGKYLRLIFIQTNERRGQPGRVAFISGKKLGNAVVRNSNKRKLRAAADECGLPFVGVDLLLIANTRTRSASYLQVTESLRKILEGAPWA